MSRSGAFKQVQNASGLTAALVYPTAQRIRHIISNATVRVAVGLIRWLLHLRDNFTFATVKTDPVRYAVVFATAGSHDPSFKRSTQASTWLIGLASPSRPDLVPTVTMGSACSQHQKWFPGSRPVWRCSSKGFDGLLCAHDSLVQRDASESLYRKIAAQLDSTFVTLHTHSHIGQPALISARIPHMYIWSVFTVAKVKLSRK
jgi:hypothetical protein